MQMRWCAGVLVVLLVSSCSTMRGSRSPLRVGITPNYPPLALMQGDKAAGIECDFAAQLSSELGRPLELVEVRWDLQLEELAAGRIDIVMSGMSITPPRKVRAAFCDSYMKNPLVAMTRRGESAGYATADEVVHVNAGIGVLAGTTADAFVRRSCPNAKIMPLSSRDDVIFYLANQRIDLYIDDLAAAVEIVSRDEARLELIRIPIAPQDLAWAVRLDNAELRQQANEALARWRTNGLLDRILNRWLPYREQLAGTALQM